MTIRTDPELVARTATGDDAYGELYRRYRPAAQRRAHQLVPCSVDAEDLVSDAFVKLLAAIRIGRPLRQCRAHLLTMVRRHAAKLNQWQVYRVTSVDDDRGEIRALISVVALHTDPTALPAVEPVRQAFRMLPPRSRVEARTPVELASLRNLTSDGAAVCRWRARRTIDRLPGRGHQLNTGQVAA